MARAERAAPEAIPRFIRKDLAALFDAGHIAVDDGEGFREMHYRISKPIVRPGRLYPLVLYLNGHARRQMDYHNIGQLSHLDTLIFQDPGSPEKYPFFLIVPQCPKDFEGNWMQWTAEGVDDGEVVDPIEAVARVLRTVISKHPIDPQAVSVFGISSGGTAAWELASRHPELFAAVVPIGSFPNPASLDRMKKLRDIPVWAFHSSGDNPKKVRQSVDELALLGGDAQLTIIPVDVHACWDEAFSEYDLLNWMLAQRRNGEKADGGNLLSPSIEWQVIKHDYLRLEAWKPRWEAFWPRALPVLAIACIYAAYRRERRRQRGKHAPAA